MYSQPVHAEESTKALFALIQHDPLGVLTTAIPSDAYPLIQSTHIPWVLDEPDNIGKATLRGHIARQNPQSKAMVEAMAMSQTASGSKLDQEVMVLFTSPQHHYVTPKFYTESKPVTGKVAPTWNYTAVQVYGRATVYYDASLEGTSNYLTRQIHDLSQHCERTIMGFTGSQGQDEPWTVSEAPASYINILKRNIVGIEVEIDRIAGKVKMSQEKGKGDREGVIQGFRKLGTETGYFISDLVTERGAMKDGVEK